MPDLIVLGWNSFFEEAFEPYRSEGYTVARVALEYTGLYRVLSESDELLSEVTGKFHFQAVSRSDFPAVGDWVVITEYASEKRAFIHAVLPRKSTFSRKAAGTGTEEQIIATNIDTVFLVAGLDMDYNLRRIERYLTVARESGARPVIILSKSDLCDSVSERVSEVKQVAPDVPVHAISSKENEGLEQLTEYLGTGITVAFLGSSGVGKSTLINRLVGKDIQRVQEVRAGDDRGRHTTRHRELIILPSGGLLIDTPGMRELQLWDVGEGLADTFADIESLAAGCRFGDCAHENEPDCAVKEAVSKGLLDAKRFENFKKMGKEVEFLDSRLDTKLQVARKERDKRIHKAMRGFYKHRRDED